MSGHFGGVSPVRQQQRAKAIGLVVGVALVVCLLIIGIISITSSKPETVEKIVEKEVPAQVEMVDVLVPIQNIEAGQELRPAMFKKDQRPKAGLPPRSIRDFEEIRGHYSRSLIAADAPLVADYITTLKPSSVLTAKIPDGYRAVTIRVDAQSAVEGWARPGARVDVVWATTIRNQNTVATIVENAEVLSAEQSTDASMAKGQGMIVPSTVTLMVTAQDAQKIQLAKTTGTLSLTLRGDSDAKTSGRDIISVDDLLNNSAKVESQVRCQGKVKISGVEYCIVNGEMIPMDQVKNRKND